MKKYQIKAEERKILGRKVKKLRREGIVPGNIFGKKIKSQSISLNIKDFLEVFNEAGETSVVEVLLGKDVRNTLIHNVQYDPVSDEPVHVDFLQVDLKQKVKSMVPVEILGESPAEKQGIGTIVQYIDEIEIEALPTEIPDSFEIDVSKLENVDDQILISDINPEKTTILEEKDKIVVKVEEVKKEEEPEPQIAAEPLAEGETQETQQTDNKESETEEEAS